MDFLEGSKLRDVTPMVETERAGHRPKRAKLLSINLGWGGEELALPWAFSGFSCRDQPKTPTVLPHPSLCSSHLKHPSTMPCHLGAFALTVFPAWCTLFQVSTGSLTPSGLSSDITSSLRPPLTPPPN